MGDHGSVPSLRPGSLSPTSSMALETAELEQSDEGGDEEETLVID